MTPFNVGLAAILLSGLVGMRVMWHIAKWKLSTESIDSPHLWTRWIYRYFIFAFWFFLSSLTVAPVTTWQLIKLPGVAEFGRGHPWLLLPLTAVPALLLYYLHRKYVIWCDPVKVAARERAEDYFQGRG